MKVLLVVILAVVTTFGCGREPEVNVVEGLESLLQTDREFATMSAEKGAADAFNQYLHEDALMLPAGGFPVKGRKAIYEVMKDAPEGYVLAWAPEDGEVARSGDFGYTWGKYTSSVPDSAGVVKKNHGKYLNVWEKDSQGDWKVLVDTGNQSPPPVE